MARLAYATRIGSSIRLSNCHGQVRDEASGADFPTLVAWP